MVGEGEGRLAGGGDPRVGQAVVHLHLPGWACVPATEGDDHLRWLPDHLHGQALQLLLLVLCGRDSSRPCVDVGDEVAGGAVEVLPLYHMFELIHRQFADQVRQLGEVDADEALDRVDDMFAAELLAKPVPCEAVLQLQAGKDEIAAHLGERDDAVEFGQPQQLLQNLLTDGNCPGVGQLDNGVRDLGREGDVLGLIGLLHHRSSENGDFGSILRVQ